MAQRIYTGFHAVEEKIRSVSISEKSSESSAMKIFYSKPGPRIKKILSQAQKAGISCVSSDNEKLDEMVKVLPDLARDHRGIILCVQGEKQDASNIIDFDQWISGISEISKDDSEKSVKTVVVLDSVTDPHNVGAIIRSADQFGASLVVIPENRGQNKIADNEIIARASAGASAWVPVSIVKNLVRTVQLLKEKGFWVYGADAGGISVQKTDFAEKSVLVMGSEGTGISKLLSENCDQIVSIPTCGKIDSLNVSVAAGVLLYERYRQTL